MNKRKNRRYLLLPYLLACVCTLTGCSNLTNFVVINASDQSVEVRYRIKKPIDPQMPSRIPHINPGILSVSELDRQIAWRELSASQYTADTVNRTVTVTLKPDEAMRIDQLRLGEDQAGKMDGFDGFAIEEISLVGAYGEIHLAGEQVGRSFIPASSKTYTLTYK